MAAEQMGQAGLKPQTPFQDREQEVGLIIQDLAETPLLNIYGVAGIGKSRLLREAATYLRIQEPQAIVIRVDVADLPAEPHARPELVLKSIIAQQPERLRGTWQNLEQVAAEVVVRLQGLASVANPKTPVFLFFDTTEHAQTDMEFWHWMEQHLVGPLAVSGKVRQIFAGRVPVPWRRFEVRRAVQLHSLGPLSNEEAAQDLIAEALRLRNPNLPAPTIRQAGQLINGLSFGHPLLSEELASYSAHRLPQALADPEAFERKLSQEVVAPFAESFLFQGIPAPWPEILKWSSVLRQFDPLLLRRYLAKLHGGLIADKEDYFFIQGLAMLRVQYSAIWYAGEGTVVHGVLRDILRRNLQLLNPAGFDRACQVSAAVYDELAAEFSSDPDEVEHYRSEAEQYRSQCRSGAYEEVIS